MDQCLLIQTQDEKFKVKRHEKDKNALYPPFYFNLRRFDHPKKPGKLTDCECERIAKIIAETIRFYSIKFNCIVGVPQTGAVFSSFLHHLRTKRPDLISRFSLISLKKGKREMMLPKESAKIVYGKKVLIVDDVLHHGDSKREAILALEQAGAKIAGIMVVIDFDIGTREILEKDGYNVFSVFTARNLFVGAESFGMITNEQKEICVQYLDQARKYYQP